MSRLADVTTYKTWRDIIVERIESRQGDTRPAYWMASAVRGEGVYLQAEDVTGRTRSEALRNLMAYLDTLPDL